MTVKIGLKKHFSLLLALLHFGEVLWGNTGVVCRNLVFPSTVLRKQISHSYNIVFKDQKAETSLGFLLLCSGSECKHINCYLTGFH